MNKLYIVINQSSGWFFFHHPCSFSIFVFLDFKNSTRKERDHRYFYIQDTQCCSFSIDSIDYENGMEWRMAATLSERAASLDWQIDRTRATAMNESVYTGEYVFNTNVYGYVLSSATTIIYKQRVKVLSAVECLSLPSSTSPLLSSSSLYTHTLERKHLIDTSNRPGTFWNGEEWREKKGSGLFCPVYRREKCYCCSF